MNAGAAEARHTTTWVVVPLPWAMRRRRLPSIIVGFCLSPGVMERIIASIFFSCCSALSPESCPAAWDSPGIISATWAKVNIGPKVT